MNTLSELEPKQVFSYFEAISSIPRGTHYTKKISDYCVRFAEERGLDVIQDPVNNVIIKQPGTSGYEECDPLILQGHLDMVWEKAPDCSHDFYQDPLELYVADGYIRARGTTLGADDGIAVAMILALLDSQDIPHPPLEALLTVDEEEGMTGAQALDMSELSGQMLINLDSEEDDELTAGCAGGFQYIYDLPITRTTKHGIQVELKIGGLLGGHSGIDINLQRGNANQLAGRLLAVLSARTDCALLDIQGGNKDNVIPTDGKICLVTTDPTSLQKVVEETKTTWQSEFAFDEPGLDLTLSVGEEGSYDVLDESSEEKVRFFLLDCPNGVYEWNRSLPDMVETSDNLGIVSSEKDQVHFVILVRSGTPSKLDEMKDKLDAFPLSLGGKGRIETSYPVWEYQEDSRIRSIVLDAFEEVGGKRPKVNTIHAGLECGDLCSKKKDLDCISFGCNTLDIHSVNERLDIASVSYVWQVMQVILRKCR